MAERWQLIDLPQIGDGRGNLTFVQNGGDLPFTMQRIYYLYDIPEGQSRANHAHRTLHQLLISVSGSFDVHLDDGWTRETFHLNRANHGLLMKPMVWRDIDNFSAGAVCLVIASALYDENDYYRNYEDFIRAVRGS